MLDDDFALSVQFRGLCKLPRYISEKTLKPNAPDQTEFHIGPQRGYLSCITKRSKIDASSFSGLFTRVEIGHIVMGSEG